MSIFNVFSLLGGLGMFLYGMKMMGNNLEKCAGGKLERILETLTSNRFKGILFGILTTAVIQSSGTVTVMLVGFVNSGIMQLEQTVGVIMGSNIGTTITAWILSLSGIGDGHFLLQLFKPQNFSPLFVFAGGIMSLFFRSDRVKNIGRILLGFGLLMYGTSVMTASMAPFSESETFRSALTLFENPFFGVLAGFSLTTLLQSSSASVGVVQALSATGAIPFHMAIPMLAGQNIGSCTTTLISSMGGSKEAKQTACIHLYFNLIGTVLFLSAYYMLNAIFAFPFANRPINGFEIALVHTIFNLFATCVMLPFTKQLTRLATWTVRGKKHLLKTSRNERTPVDERLLKTPDFAIEACKNEMKKMMDAVLQNTVLCCELLTCFEREQYGKAQENEQQIDRYEDFLATYLAKLSSQKTTAETAKTTSLYLHAIHDIERIGDHAWNMANSAKVILEEPIVLSEIMQEELEILKRLLGDILTNTFTTFQSGDVFLAKQVEPMEETMDRLVFELKNRNVQRIQTQSCTVHAAILCLDLLNDFERISDHCSNLAIYVIQAEENRFSLHEYSDHLKRGADPFFQEFLEELLDQYTLPSVESQAAETEINLYKN